MASVPCSVPGCTTHFTPGKGGGPGKDGKPRCGMHLARERRGSPNADVAGKVRDGSRSATITTYCAPDFKARVKAAAKRAGFSSASDWSEKQLLRAVERAEQRAKFDPPAEKKPHRVRA